MKNFTIAILLAFLIIASSQVHANVYSAQLSITNPDGTPFDGSFTDGTGAQFSFILNDTASSVAIRVKDVLTDSVAAEINAGARSRGLHQVEWDGSGAVAGATYYYEITAEQPNSSETDWTIFYDSGGIGIFTRGGDIVKDMSSELFGLFYAPNTGGSLGIGINIYNPDGSFHDPFLVASSENWGTGDPTAGGAFDDEKRFYVSSLFHSEIRRLNKDYTITPVVTGLSNPKGLFIHGEGEDRVIYVCVDLQVLRIPIGNADVFTGTPEIIGEFTAEFGYPRNAVLDDEGFMYVNFRTSPSDLNATGAGLYKFDISGQLPVAGADAMWGIGANLTFKISDMIFDYGDDRNSAADDILYYATRAESGNPEDGVWRVDDVNSAFPAPQSIILEADLYGGDNNINARSAIMMDAAGNIILLENANEHIFFLSPPNEGATNSFVTVSPDSFTVDVETSIKDGVKPEDFYLAQNFPNPFNPSTNINFGLPAASAVDLRIYNLLGEEVAVLINNEFKSAGNYSIQFNASNLPSGVYVYRLASGEIISSKKMILTK
jgi:hypothetical protein